MSTYQPPKKYYQIYPAYCFQASPTYNAWVKLTAADVQALRLEPEFQSQRIYFHLNHPIRYVRIVGVVVAIDDINIKYTVLTVDDGSGATIELKIVRLTPDLYNPVDSPSNTVIDNVNVVSQFGVFDVTVDHRQLDIGTVVKAKGTISEFRDVKQLELKRIWTVLDTNEEAKAWAETAAFKTEVLSTRWRLSSADHRKILKEMRRDERKAKDYARQKAEYATKKKEHRKAQEASFAQREVRLERRRRQEEIIMNAGALV